MQEEGRRCIPFAARFLDIVQISPIDVQVEFRSRIWFVGHDRLVLGDELGPLDDMRYVPPLAVVVAAGSKACNVVLGEIDAGHTFVVEHHAALSEEEVEVDKSMLPAVVGKVVEVRREDVQEEGHLGVIVLARFFEVVHRVVFDVHVEISAR